MSSFSRFQPHLWLVALLTAALFLLWSQDRRADSVDRISALTGDTARPDSSSPTGYAGGVRLLLIPGQNYDSMQWIAQTQLMLTDGTWRLRHVDYDNAPTGRPVRSSSAYRWWLAFVAWTLETFAGAPAGISVERAALWADPLLQVLLLIAGTVLTARRFGSLPALLFSLGFIAWYPLAGAFVPGQPNDRGLTLACALGSVLPLVAALAGRAPLPRRAARRSFVIAGIFGGLGLWVEASSQIPILLGIVAGGLLAAWLFPRVFAEAPATPPGGWPWRPWATSGAVTVIVMFAVEFLPGSLPLAGWQLDIGHPLYGIAWLGIGDLLTRFTIWRGGASPLGGRRDLIQASVAALAVVTPAVAVMTTADSGFLAPWSDPERISFFHGASAASNTLLWFSIEGIHAAAWSTVLPLLFVVIAGVRLTAEFRATRPAPGVALLIGPALVACGFAFAQVRWWSAAGLLLLLLVVALVARSQSADRPKRASWLLTGLAGLPIGAGLIAIWPAGGSVDAADETDVFSMIERDLAHWLSARAPEEGAIAMAPPGLSASLYYYGGVRGLGTPHRENKAGFDAAVRLAAASSADEGQALAVNRGITHFVIPSWDRLMDEYARIGSTQVDRTLIASIQQWLAPRWLQPLPYEVPAVPGMPRQTADLYRVVDPPSHASALASLAHYFLETGRFEMAADVCKSLADTFPTDLAAHLARGENALARHDPRELTALVSSIKAAVERGDESDLLWDERVRLALLLEQIGQMEAARPQLEWCAGELDRERVRQLSTVTIFRLLSALAKHGIAVADSDALKYGKSLLPASMQAKL